MKNHEKSVKALIDRIMSLPPEVRKRRMKLGKLNEMEILRQAIPFLARELKAEVSVHEEGEEGLYDPKTRASKALPHRPAIYIEFDEKGE